VNRDEKLQTSKYLRIVPRPEDFAVYHSLFGGICIVDREILALFELFNSPQSLNEITGTGEYSIERIESFVRTFKPRYFLVNPDFDEYGLIEKKINHRKKHLHTGEQIGVVQLVVTNLCNFRCKYCFIDSIYSSEERFELQSSESNKVMDINIADVAMKQAITIVRRSGGKSLHIQFFGGEPLLNWKVIKFVLDTFGDGSTYGIEIGYSIVTNGSLIKEEMAEYFEKYNVPVVVSFDSPKGRDRVFTNEENCTPAIEHSLSVLRKYDNRIVLNAVLSEETFDYFDTDIVDFAVKYGVSEIGVLLDLNPEFYENRGPGEIVDKLWDIHMYAKENGVIITGYWHMIFQQIMAYEFFKDRGYKTCSATGCQLSIEPSGDVFACKGSSGYFGHISRLPELLSSEPYRKYAMRAFRNADACEGCEIENFCSGFCFGPLEKKYNDIYVVEEKTCEVYKEITKRLIMDLDRSEVDIFVMYDSASR
jgi:uncharacterized protein